MKKYYTTLLLLLISFTCIAQAPEKMSYQAVVKDASNNYVISQTVGMQISIFKGGTLASPGFAVYTEIHTPITSADGIVSLEIGTGTTTDTFSAIDWSSDVYFIKTEYDLLGGTTYTISDISQFLSVPYALHAKTAATADNALPTGGTEGQVLSINSSGEPEWSGSIFYEDKDGDGFGNANILVVASRLPQCHSTNNLDCNDSDDTINPNAPELFGDGLDNDCDGQIDELAIGQLRYGGIVFYIAPTPIDLNGDGNVDTGLVCTIKDLTTRTEYWYNGSYITTGATGTRIGTGSENTSAIITTQGSPIERDYVAGVAGRHTGGGFTDWFLPSIDELNVMYVNKEIINATAALNSGSAFGRRYWSSSEFANNRAWFIDFSYGGIYYYDKSNTLEVRAVRAF